MNNTEEVTKTESKTGDRLADLRKNIAKTDSENRNNLVFSFGISSDNSNQPLGWSQWSQFDNFNQWSNIGW